jgi:GNAT superfamily N-acetyltransferase
MIVSARKGRRREGSRMLEWADRNWLRMLAYAIVAAFALAAGRREDEDDAATWRPFWPMTAGIFFVMALGRAQGLAEWLIDQIRGEAYDAGWYDARRPLQAAVVLIVGAGWLISVVTACWRIPERRRRYLPMTVVVLTVGAFVAVRAVSLHQVDSVLYRTDIAGLRVGTLTEYLLLGVAVACTFWSPSPSTGLAGSPA